MEALTLARKRLRARIQSPSSPRPVRLAHGLVEDGRTRFLPILSSPLAQDILAQGYDARTLDRIYANRPASEFGVVGRVADRVILDLPVHEGLRERREAACGEICAAAVMAVRAGEPEFRVLCAPCGLAAELLLAAERLREDRPETFRRLRCWGVDPDGTLLLEAARRARSAGVNARFIREDLRRRRDVAAVAAAEGPYHLISCVGLTQGRSAEELSDLVSFYAGLLAPGGTLLLDRWQPAGKSRIASGLGLGPTCHSAREVASVLQAAGLAVEREHPTGEGGCVLLVARKATPAAPR